MVHPEALRNPGNGIRRPAVGTRQQKPVSARAERRAMIALVAMFTLLVQMLAPTLAVAASGPGEQVVCTSHGLQTIEAGDDTPAKPAPTHVCDHCVCPPVAATPAAMIQPAVFVAFAREVAPPEALSADLPPPARAPPRPPGQGPPVSNA